jgi:hypothetical protein
MRGVPAGVAQSHSPTASGWLPVASRPPLAVVRRSRQVRAVSLPSGRVGSATTWRARLWPAILMITSSPALGSASSVTRVWQLSCWHLTTFALSLSFVHAGPVNPWPGWWPVPGQSIRSEWIAGKPGVGHPTVWCTCRAKIIHGCAATIRIDDKIDFNYPPSAFCDTGEPRFIALGVPFVGPKTRPLGILT